LCFDADVGAVIYLNLHAASRKAGKDKHAGLMK